MFILQNILIALQSLKTNPLRSVLTLTGIAVGIGAVLYVVILGNITQQRINKRLESLGSNVLLIRPGYSHMKGIRTAERVINLKWDEAKEIKATSDVITLVVPRYTGQGIAEFKDQSWNTRITGTTPEYETVNNDHPIEGRFFSGDELSRRARVCLLGATVHEKLFGNRSPIGESIIINSKRFTVIGLLGAKGESWHNPDDGIFIPLTTAQERLYGVDYLSSILAQMHSADDYDESLFDIETILRHNHRLRPDEDNDFRVRRQDLYLSTVRETNLEISNFIIIIALVSLIVGGIGIANVMLVTVTERTREIGLRRAVGAKKFHILTQFIVEAMILGIIGGILGTAGCMGFNYFFTGNGLSIPLNWLGYSFVICSGIGSIAGLYPAIQAANKNVIDALRYE